MKKTRESEQVSHNFCSMRLADLYLQTVLLDQNMVFQHFQSLLSMAFQSILPKHCCASSANVPQGMPQKILVHAGFEEAAGSRSCSAEEARG